MGENAESGRAGELNTAGRVVAVESSLSTLPHGRVTAPVPAVPGWTPEFKLLLAASHYRELWMICHESSPRPAKVGELQELGQVRGRLFAAISAVRTAPPKETR